MAVKMLHSKKEIDGVFVKPCPFCGSTNLIVSEEDSFNSIVKEHGSAMVDVECAVCKTEVKLFNVPGNNYWMGIGMLIAKWNTRNGGNKDAD